MTITASRLASNMLYLLVGLRPMTSSTVLHMYAEFCLPDSVQMVSLDQRLRSNDNSILTTSSCKVCCQMFVQLAVFIWSLRIAGSDSNSNGTASIPCLLTALTCCMSQPAFFIKLCVDRHHAESKLTFCMDCLQVSPASDLARSSCHISSTGLS